jgi:hypothetical protein
MAHDTGDASIGDEHYEVPLEGIQTGRRDLRSKTDPSGRYFDNLLRDLLGGEPVGGDPTDILGILPQAPTRGVNGDVSISDLNRMLEATPGAVGADPSIGGELDLTGGDVAPIGVQESILGRAPVPGAISSVGPMDVGEEFDPGSVGPSTTQANRIPGVQESPNQLQEGAVAGLGVGPATPIGRGEQQLGPNAQSEAVNSLMLMLAPLAATGGAAAPAATGIRGSAQGANPFFQAIRNFLGIGRGPKVPPSRQLGRPQGQGGPVSTPSVIRRPPPTGTQGELFGTMG